MLYLGPVWHVCNGKTSAQIHVFHPDNTQFTDSECATVFVCGRY